MKQKKAFLPQGSDYSFFANVNITAAATQFNIQKKAEQYHHFPGQMARLGSWQESCRGKSGKIWREYVRE